MCKLIWERGLPYKTSTRLLVFFTPCTPLCPQNQYCLSANLLNILTPPPLHCVRHTHIWGPRSSSKNYNIISQLILPFRFLIHIQMWFTCSFSSGRNRIWITARSAAWGATRWGGRSDPARSTSSPQVRYINITPWMQVQSSVKTFLQGFGSGWLKYCTVV